MAKFTTTTDVLNELRNAPATIQEIAEEMGLLEDTAGACLRQLYKKGRVVRRKFYAANQPPRWLYMLPEHAAQLKKG